MNPPVARIKMVHDRYFGTVIDDPYRWLEDWKGSEARAWVAAQGEYSRRYLQALPERASLLARIGELSGAAPLLTSFQVVGDRAFYLRREPGQDMARLVVRLTPDAPERVLFDPNALAGPVHTAIDWYVASRDGARVAFGLSQGGSEASVLHVVQVDDGEILGLRISRVVFGVVSWLEDNRSFLYLRLSELPEGAPESEKYDNSRTYIHRLGDDPESDPVVFGVGVNSAVHLASGDFPFIFTSPASEWVVGYVQHGVLNEATIYTAPYAALANPATTPWRKVADVADAVTGFDIAGETIVLKSHKDAPHFKVLATSASAPDLASAVAVVPESSMIIQDMRLAGAYVLTRDLDGGFDRLRRTPLAGGTSQPIALPFAGSIREIAGAPAAPQVLLQMTSWTISPRVFRCVVPESSVADTGWLAPSPVDFSDIEAHEVRAPASDGTVIPLSIIHRKGLLRDGGSPTLLMGYGWYGMSLEPSFAPAMLAWYERGGVYAIAHLRGGGEYGEEWHSAGQKLNKENTITDFIACADYLIANGYTRPTQLAGEGTSAGGIPSGGALVRTPDLWAVMVIRVGVTNSLRMETSENGPNNVPEFGSVSTEEGFRALLITDSYGRVRDGVAYPAVMLTTGLNDPRMVVWQASKMAARLQAATSSGKPILLRVEEQGGHGMGATKRQTDEELADKLAFLLDQFS